MATVLAGFRQGETKVIKIDYGTGFDITGYSFEFRMSNCLDDTVPDVKVSGAVGDDSRDDAVNGIKYLQLESDVSALVPAGNYFYTLKRIKPNINVAKADNVKVISPPIDKYDYEICVLPSLPA